MARGAASLETLRKQINARWPNRDKRSDGGEGDKAHKLRKSDHNPVNGVFHARDFTHDPINGLSGKELANAIAAARDPRVDYMISDGEIMFGKWGTNPWKWVDYNGANPHDHHMHLSVVDDPNLAEDNREWDLSAYKVSQTVPDHPANIRWATIKRGAKGDVVIHLQKLLNKNGWHLKEDGDFGRVTEEMVKNFQRVNGLAADGKVGPYTWDKLEKVT